MVLILTWVGYSSVFFAMNLDFDPSFKVSSFHLPNLLIPNTWVMFLLFTEVHVFQKMQDGRQKSMIAATDYSNNNAAPRQFKDRPSVAKIGWISWAGTTLSW